MNIVKKAIAKLQGYTKYEACNSGEVKYYIDRDVALANNREVSIYPLRPGLTVTMRAGYIGANKAYTIHYNGEYDFNIFASMYGVTMNITATTIRVPVIRPERRDKLGVLNLTLDIPSSLHNREVSKYYDLVITALMALALAKATTVAYEVPEVKKLVDMVGEDHFYALGCYGSVTDYYGYLMEHKYPY